MGDGAESDPADLSRVSADRLAALWPHAAHAPSLDWNPSEFGDVLRHQLRAPLAAAAPGQRTVADLLYREAAPSVEELRQLKEWAKSHMARDDGDIPREVAGVIYFAAIVRARMIAGQNATGGDHRISELDNVRLRAGVDWALGQPWLDRHIADVLRSGLTSFEGE